MPEISTSDVLKLLIKEFSESNKRIIDSAEEDRRSHSKSMSELGVSFRVEMAKDREVLAGSLIELGKTITEVKNEVAGVRAESPKMAMYSLAIITMLASVALFALIASKGIDPQSVSQAAAGVQVIHPD